jgi:hypothetical protein
VVDATEARKAVEAAGLAHKATQARLQAKITSQEHIISAKDQQVRRLLPSCQATAAAILPSA